jgi:NAD(P)-dependent dehydrogenase (short-subunit alcohol dehydrogenase family)
VTRRGALVTGAESHLGRAVVARLVRDGFEPIGAALSADAMDDTIRLTGDLSTPEIAEDIVRQATRLVGELRTIVCVAGRMPIGRIEDTTPAELEAAMRGSFLTFFNVARAAVTLLPPGSSIVAVSSVNATLAAPGVAAYAGSKGAVEAVVRQLALDQASRGIRVNAVAPGAIADGRMDGLGAGYPRGTAVTTEEVANVIAFLASPDASGVTGAVIPVDAGLSITSPATFLREDLRDRLKPRG